ncbi:MAG: L-threonylcarbamoyladenylate synthase [Litorimonas sp.]
MTDYAEINDALTSGGVILLPTETVYGLACSAQDPQAVEKIYAIKGRDFEKPLAVCVQNIDEAQKFGIFEPKALELAKRYWPGSLTIIVEATDNPAVNAKCLSKLDDKLTIAFRCPDASWREHLTGPLALTSANRTGEKECVSYAQGLKEFADEIDASLSTDVDLSASPSTIVSTLNGQIEILRQGALEVHL